MQLKVFAFKSSKLLGLAERLSDPVVFNELHFELDGFYSVPGSNEFSGKSYTLM